MALLIATPQLSQLACRSRWQMGRSVRKQSKTRAEVQNLTSAPPRPTGCPVKSLTDKSRQWRQESRRNFLGLKAHHVIARGEAPGYASNKWVNYFFKNPLSASHSSKRSIHLLAGLGSFTRRPKPWPLPA